MPKRIYTQTFAVAAAIIEKKGKILLVQEARGRDKGKWNQPGGLIEVGEHPLVAVQREVKEETGFDFTPKAILGIYSIVRYRLRNKGAPGIPHGVTIVFRGTIKNQSHQSSEEISQVAWFTPEEIYAMNGETLRDPDVKVLVRDCMAGKTYSLNLLHHTVEK